MRLEGEDSRDHSGLEGSSEKEGHSFPLAAGSLRPQLCLRISLCLLTINWSFLSYSWSSFAYSWSSSA